MMLLISKMLDLVSLKSRVRQIFLLVRLLFNFLEVVVNMYKQESKIAKKLLHGTTQEKYWKLKK